MKEKTPTFASYLEASVHFLVHVFTSSGKPVGGTQLCERVRMGLVRRFGAGGPRSPVSRLLV